ncbi:MAG TPA: DUF3306 domain-containing protein [Xanthobacteraceae bacterium]|jgi:hypothetical protein|nr:DUF3306 domain-containing protein [Xanthobacteraceae bacterium]
MSADDSFLARWARRKRAGATNARGQPNPNETGDQAAPEASLPPRETQSLVDPKSLPPIETIGAGSDIRSFLANGVPADLTRAALRRAWSADPAIRDFIGLSENSWDFNAPSGVPGFGSLTMEDARRLLARVMEETEALGPGRRSADRLSDDQAPAPVSEADQTTTGSAADQMKLGPNTDADHESPMPRDGKRDIAVQHEREGREPRRSVPRRRHGGALPN